MPTGGAETRGRLLAAARRRFAEQGYASTSLAQLADDLGTTKAALYYYFRSKADVLDALLDDATRSYQALADFADTSPPARALLERYVDAMAGTCQVIIELHGDRSALAEHGERHDIGALEARILRALAPGRTPAARVRATAALGAARAGVQAALALGDDGTVDPRLRREIVSAAAATLKGAG